MSSGFQFGKPIDADRMIVEQTDQRWRGEGQPSKSDNQFSLL